MSPAPPSPLTVLTSPDTTSPGTIFTPPTIIALILLLLLATVVLGTLLVFALRRRPSRTPTDTSTEDKEANFLDLEAGSRKSPFFEVVDNTSRSSLSAWARITGSVGVSSTSRATEPELPWPVYTVLPHLRPKEPFYRRMVAALVFWREESKREPFTVADVQRARDDVEAQARPASIATYASVWTWIWHKAASLFRGKLPEIVIHPCDGSPAFAYFEDLDNTPASLRERRLLARCEAIAALEDVEQDSCPISVVPEPKVSPPTPFAPLATSLACPSLDDTYSDFPGVPPRPSTPLGMARVDEPLSSTSATGCTNEANGEGLVSRFSSDDLSPPTPQESDFPICAINTHSASREEHPEINAPSNSSSESSVADIISALEDISEDSSASSDSLSLRTSFSDDSIALQSSRRKRFSGVFDAIKRVSLQSLDLGLKLDLEAIANADVDFSRSTYYGVLGEYGPGGRQERDSVASEDSL